MFPAWSSATILPPVSMPVITRTTVPGVPFASTVNLSISPVFDQATTMVHGKPLSQLMATSWGSIAVGVPFSVTLGELAQLAGGFQVPIAGLYVARIK